MHKKTFSAGVITVFSHPTFGLLHSVSLAVPRIQRKSEAGKRLQPFSVGGERRSLATPLPYWILTTVLWQSAATVSV